MPDMYDKLGEMLNDVLESGKIPQNDKKLNPVDKVALKQKQLKEHDEKMKNIVQKKVVPVFNDKANESHSVTSI